MTTAAVYRQYAEECRCWAREAKNDKARQAFLDMAQSWTHAASLYDRIPITDTLPVEQQHVSCEIEFG